MRCPAAVRVQLVCVPSSCVCPARVCVSSSCVREFFLRVKKKKGELELMHSPNLLFPLAFAPPHTYIGWPWYCFPIPLPICRLTSRFLAGMRMILTLLAVATSHPAELQLTSRNTCRESSAARAKGAPPNAQAQRPSQARLVARTSTASQRVGNQSATFNRRKRKMSDI